MDTFATLNTINVNDKVEKKNNLSYLSWAWAVEQLLLRDNSASWEYLPPVQYGDTLMVFCRVSAFGVTRTAQLPVMDHKNKAIANPDAFAVNTAMMRCLAKAIALHGIGLYIYAGEDLPNDGIDHEREAAQKRADALIAKFATAATEAELEAMFPQKVREQKPTYPDIFNDVLLQFEQYKEAFQLAAKEE